VNHFSRDDPGGIAQSGNPEDVRSHPTTGKGPTGAQIYGQRTHDPVPANTEAEAGHNPGIPQPAPPRRGGHGRSAPFARQSARPRGAGGGALIHVHVTSTLDGRQVGRGMAKVAARDVAGP